MTQQLKPEKYPNVDDEGTIILTYPHAQAIIQGSWNWPFDRKDMEVYGATGSLMTIKSDKVLRAHAGREGGDGARSYAAGAAGGWRWTTWSRCSTGIETARRPDGAGYERDRDADPGCGTDFREDGPDVN